MANWVLILVPLIAALAVIDATYSCVPSSRSCRESCTSRYRCSRAGCCWANNRCYEMGGSSSEPSGSDSSRSESSGSDSSHSESSGSDSSHSESSGSDSSHSESSRSDSSRSESSGSVSSRSDSSGSEPSRSESSESEPSHSESSGSEPSSSESSGSEPSSSESSGSEPSSSESSGSEPSSSESSGSEPSSSESSGSEPSSSESSGSEPSRSESDSSCVPSTTMCSVSCASRERCEAQNCCWKNGACYESQVEVCVPSSTPCGQSCGSEDQCEQAGCCWQGGRCYEPDDSCVRCPYGWHVYDGGCYYVSDSAACDWSHAVTKCKYRGGHLVVIQDSNEQSFVESIAHSSVDYWIGLKWYRSYWSWVDNSGLGYTDWKSGEPNTNYYGSETCVRLIGAKWRDMQCGANYKYICETEGESCDEPTTTTPEPTTTTPEPTTTTPEPTTTTPEPTTTTPEPTTTTPEPTTTTPEPTTTTPEPTTTTPVDICVVCPDGWMPYDGRCYYVSDGSACDWSYSHQHCVDMGGYLVHIDDYAEHKFIGTIVHYDCAYWIGLRWNGNCWHWTDNSELEWTRWSSGEPNTNDPGQDTCVRYTKNYWKDMQCGASYEFICESEGEECEEYICTECPDGWMPYNLGCYQVSDFACDWNSARKHCNAEGGHLVDIANGAEETFVESITQDNKHHWIGLKWTGYTWEWRDNSGLGYTNWYPGEPNSNDDGRKRCVRLSGSSWQDISCNKDYKFVCEKPGEECQEGTTESPPTTMEPLTECLGLDLDVVFLVDSSTSITGINFKLVQQFMGNVIGCLHIGSDNTRVGIIQFETNPTVILELGQNNNKGEVHDIAANMVYFGGTTDTGAAIDESVLQFQSNSREGAQPVLVVVTDGKSNFPQDTAMAVANARQAIPDLQILSVAVSGVTGGGGQPADIAELRLIATGPGDMNVLTFNDFEALVAAFEDVGLLICVPESTPTTPPGVACGEVVVFIDEQKDWFLEHYGVYELDTTLLCEGQYTYRHTNMIYYIYLHKMGPNDFAWVITTQPSCSGSSVSGMFVDDDLSGPISALTSQPNWIDQLDNTNTNNGAISTCF